QNVHNLIKIPAFAGMTGGEAGMTGGEAGMTGSAGTVESVVTAVRTGVAPETCNSSLGTPISALAGTFQVCDVV
ncbi:MAG TPA: hypothetical protein PKN92_11650, partial [Candidatus Hydrogenedentes bacterium]|nr:hypothetical protein [Candidatus Hydrogenedentota bacterium]